MHLEIQQLNNVFVLTSPMDVMRWKTFLMVYFSWNIRLFLHGCNHLESKYDDDNVMMIVHEQPFSTLDCRESYGHGIVLYEGHTVMAYCHNHDQVAVYV